MAISPSKTDSTETMCNLPKLKMLRCKKKGRAAQMNEASTFAKGEILVFLHADVVPPIGFIDDIHHSLYNGFDAGFFRTDLIRIVGTC